MCVFRSSSMWYLSQWNAGENHSKTPSSHRSTALLRVDRRWEGEDSHAGSHVTGRGRSDVSIDCITIFCSQWTCRSFVFQDRRIVADNDDEVWRSFESIFQIVAMNRKYMFSNQYTFDLPLTLTSSTNNVIVRTRSQLRSPISVLHNTSVCVY